MLVSSFDQFNSACESDRRIGGNGKPCTTTQEKREESQKRAIALANAVNQIYVGSDMGIKVTLVAHVSFETRSAEKNEGVYESAGGSINGLLNKFTSWYKQSNNGDLRSDAAHLIDNQDRSGGTAGLAWVGTTCNVDGSSSGVNEDTNDVWYQYTAETIAHELGHNLGADTMAMATIAQARLRHEPRQHYMAHAQW